VTTNFNWTVDWSFYSQTLPAKALLAFPFIDYVKWHIFAVKAAMLIVDFSTDKRTSRY
jgi:hypothetical protein